MACRSTAHALLCSIWLFLPPLASLVSSFFRTLRCLPRYGWKVGTIARGYRQVREGRNTHWSAVGKAVVRCSEVYWRFGWEVYVWERQTHASVRTWHSAFCSVTARTTERWYIDPELSILRHNNKVVITCLRASIRRPLSEFLAITFR